MAYEEPKIEETPEPTLTEVPDAETVEAPEPDGEEKETGIPPEEE